MGQSNSVLAYPLPIILCGPVSI